jgi:hypothetical protein
LSKGWNGSNSGLINACFWAFARIGTLWSHRFAYLAKFLSDVWAAFLLEEETLIPTGDWVDDSDVRSIAATGTLDAYCNIANLIFAKMINLFQVRNDKDSYPTGNPRSMHCGVNYKIGEVIVRGKFFFSFEQRHIQGAHFRLFYILAARRFAETLSTMLGLFCCDGREV